jgi:hypothetical protein
VQCVFVAVHERTVSDYGGMFPHHIKFFYMLQSCNVELGIILISGCFLLQCLAAWEEVLPDMKGVDTSSYSPSNKPQLQLPS